jgi:hypothetical protein
MAPGLVGTSTAKAGEKPEWKRKAPQFPSGVAGLFAFGLGWFGRGAAVKLPKTRVVSIGRCTTQLRPTLIAKNAG